MMSLSSPPFNSPYPSSTMKRWDPETILELTNPARDDITCVGRLKGGGRRCQRHMARSKAMHACSILNKLACDSASKAKESPVLREAVDILLCWQHDYQTSTVLKQWNSKLDSWATSHESRDSSSTAYTKPYVKEESMENLSTEELGNLLRQMQENLARIQAEMRQRDWERQREPERQRKEEEQRRKEEQERKEEQGQKEENEKREQKARDEAFRERARLKREKREREAREKAEKEAAEWRDTWQRYFKKCNMKSGLQSDVNEANVKLFFAKAPPKELVDSGEKRFKLMSAENKRWHTDKVMQRFGPDVVNGAAKNALVIVATVVIKLRQEAQRER
ncbi:hypothetical protein F4804DRAFT_346640 [Jackrogersella minutella]|nr:hypothetical protein F4804DRAFT_346640 [Jackrogersella minutella]